MVVGAIIAIVAMLIVNWLVAKRMEEIVFLKGYGKEIHSFALCFWLGIIGYIYVLALPDLTQRKLMEQLLAKDAPQKPQPEKPLKSDTPVEPRCLFCNQQAEPLTKYYARGENGEQHVYICAECLKLHKLNDL